MWSRYSTLSVLLAAVGLFALSGAVVGHPGDVVLTIASPGPSPQGLAWDGEYLWVADDSTNTIYKLDPSDGNVVACIPTGGASPRGLAWDGGHLWNADDSSHLLYGTDPATGRAVSVVRTPVMETKRGTSLLGGLAWDGRHLWSGFIAGWSSRMNRTDTCDGSVNRFIFTKGVPSGLASDGMHIWNATHNGGIRLGLIYKYKLSDGLYVSHFDAPGYYPVGLAFDGQYLWCVDRETKQIYRIVVE